MSQPENIFIPPTPNYITPINCPHCSGSARLMHRSPAVTQDGKGEMRTFGCYQCGERTEMFMRDDGPAANVTGN
jgi:hypothetical protein